MIDDDTQDFDYKEVQPDCPVKPLFMPVGSVRAILAIIVVSAFVTICVQTDHVEALAVIATMIAKDYFDSRGA